MFKLTRIPWVELRELAPGNCISLHRLEQPKAAQVGVPKQTKYVVFPRYDLAGQSVMSFRPGVTNTN